MELDDKKIKVLLKESKLEMPFSDFEESMMARIQSFERQQAKANQSRFFALLSFLIGTVFGFILNFMLSNNLNWISTSIDVQNSFYLLSQIIYVVLILLFSDKLWKLWKIKKSTGKGSF